MSLLNTFIYSENKAIRILRHVLFWATDFLSYLVIISDTPITPTIIFNLFSRLPLITAVVYVILYYLIPTYSKAQNKLGLFLWVCGIIIFIGFGFRLYGYYVVDPILKKEATPLNLFSASRILRELFSWMGVVVLAIAIKLMKTKNLLQQQNEELVREKRIAELSFLKAQMHPHFLFNTLNTLYSDAIKTNSKSEQIVLRLSNLMRFILEECNKPLIPLEKEIKVVDDYIGLEKLRHGDRLQIDWQNNISNPHVLISPLLLLPFVENSCKHTLLSQRGIIHIKIRIDSTNDFITLYVENELTKQPTLNGASHGMGMRNVKKQLELLFDKNFTLDIKVDAKYIVNLKVPTSIKP
jgi:two-component system, LytTR family, sensor kinase